MLFRVDLTNNAVVTMATPNFVCMDFAFDNGFFTTEAVLCQAALLNGGNRTLLGIDVASGDVAYQAVFPYLTVDGSDYAYDPFSQTYYLRLDSSVGVEPRSPACSANRVWTLWCVSARRA